MPRHISTLAAGRLQGHRTVLGRAANASTYMIDIPHMFKIIIIIKIKNKRYNS